MTSADPVTLAAAHKALGFTCSLLTFRRRLLAFEKRSGVVLLTRAGSPAKPSYLVTVAAIRRHFPEWFGVDMEREQTRGLSAIAREVAGAVREYREDLDELTAKVAALAKTVGEIVAWSAEMKRACPLPADVKRQGRAPAAPRVGSPHGRTARLG